MVERGRFVMVVDDFLKIDGRSGRGMSEGWRNGKRRVGGMVGGGISGMVGDG